MISFNSNPQETQTNTVDNVISQLLINGCSSSKYSTTTQMYGKNWKEDELITCQFSHT